MNDLLHPSMTEKQLNAMSALALAHIGDAVFELLVRTQLCLSGGTTNSRLHQQTVAQVCAQAQAKLADKLQPLLTEQENAWYHRGRNVHPHAIPKSASPSQYAKATGVEALFGALYLRGEQERIIQLFEAVTEDNNAI